MAPDRLTGFLTGLALVAVGFALARRRRRDRVVQAETATEADPEVQQATETPADALRISPREREILEQLAKGYTTKQMGECLQLSPETVKWYRKKLLAKFDAANVAELISTAKEQGLV